MAVVTSALVVRRRRDVCLSVSVVTDSSRRDLVSLVAPAGDDVTHDSWHRLSPAMTGMAVVTYSSRRDLVSLVAPAGDDVTSSGAALSVVVSQRKVDSWVGTDDVIVISWLIDVTSAWTWGARVAANEELVEK